MTAQPQHPSRQPARRFWENLDGPADNIALIEGELILTYAQLAKTVREEADRLHTGSRKLAFLVSERNVQSIVCYLALLTAGHAVFLCGEIGQELVELYRPDMILSQPTRRQPLVPAHYKHGAPMRGHELLLRVDASDALPSDLGLLLSTSGSTGTAKLVRLSHRNIATAAEQMRETLRISGADRAITGIPLDHVYGLSALHSQLAAGGALVLTDKSTMHQSFWNCVRDGNVTVMGGVPWTYKTMKDIGAAPERFPALRKLHQSGAKLDRETYDWLCETFPRHGVELYFMYGQTEAAGRMCVLPPGMARTKTGSVGLAVPGGRIAFEEDGEIVYSGPNVMLGYAKCRDDLYHGDEMNGALHTGDLGQTDGDGCLYLTGRKSRICKILGNRINLDDLEALFPDAAIVGDDTQLILYFEGKVEEETSRRADMLADRLRIPRQSITLRHTRAFPRSAAGKIMHDKLHAAIKQTISQDDDEGKHAHAR